jgi:hypothetical protein
MKITTTLYVDGIDGKPQLEIGDRVQVSGEWFTVDEVNLLDETHDGHRFFEVIATRPANAHEAASFSRKAVEDEWPDIIE